jgi:uncharacterized membrane protein HdeD (DUF308 family)
MNTEPRPLLEQLAIFVLAPPIMASLVWMMSRGWAKAVQGGAVSEATKRRQKIEFWGFVIFGYAAALAVFLYSWPR